MARSPKPWWNAATGEYNVNIRGARHRLGPDKNEAQRAFHALMSKPPAAPAAPDDVAHIMDEFLAWVRTHRAPETLDWYQKHCRSFTDYLKARGRQSLLVKDLAPHHVLDWVNSHEWSDGTKNGACRAVQRAFNWALKRGRLKLNPIATIDRKPSPGRREEIISPAEYAELMKHVKDGCFRDLLIVSWECGCRPQESLRVERRHVNESHKRWEFPTRGAKGKKTVRFVCLTDNALEITRKLMRKHPEGRLFRLGPASVNCSFVRLRHKMGRAVMKQRGIVVDDEAVTRLAATLPRKKIAYGKTVEKTERERLDEARRKLMDKEAANHAPKLCLSMFRRSFMERLRQAVVDSVNVAALLEHVDLGC